MLLALLGKITRLRKTYLIMQAVSCVQMCVINYITSSVQLKKEKLSDNPQSLEAKRKIMISVPSV